jgi:hypothetical protein
VICITNAPATQVRVLVNVHFVTFSGRRATAGARAGIVKGLIGQGYLRVVPSRATVLFIT